MLHESTVDPTQPLVWNERQVAEALGIGRSTLQTHLRQGRVPPGFLLGGRRLWPVEDIRLFVALQGDIGRFIAVKVEQKHAAGAADGEQ